jgi:hypothetical protein
MIEIGGGSITWQGVHVIVEVPQEPSDGWSMFYLKRIDSVHLTDSVLTVRNVGPRGDSMHAKVSFFELEPQLRPVDADVLGMDNGELKPPAVQPPQHLHIERCIVRGQATLVRGEQAMPFRVVCEQSLIVTSERLLDLGGFATKPRLQDGRIDVVLKHVTAVVRRGMYRLSTREDALHHLELVSDCRASILYVRDVKAPVVERLLANGATENGKRLYLRGRDNFYLGSTNLLRVYQNGDAASFLDYGFDQPMEDWYKEESPRFSLMWNSLPAQDVPVDTHTPEHYRLAQSQNNPAFLSGDGAMAGVNIALLPPIPDESNW